MALFRKNPKVEPMEFVPPLNEDEINNPDIDSRPVLEQMQDVMERWFRGEFIEKHRSWHAVYGHRYCKPIPISSCFSFPGDEIKKRYVWPIKMPDWIDTYLVDLGFLTTGRTAEGNLGVMVPQMPRSRIIRKSFAQQWVERINNEYARYCDKERKRADASFQQMMTELCEWPEEKIVKHDGRFLYRDYFFSHVAHIGSVGSPQYQKFFRRRLSEYEILEVTDQEGNYVGLICADRYAKE